MGLERVTGVHFFLEGREEAFSDSIVIAGSDPADRKPNLCFFSILGAVFTGVDRTSIGMKNRFGLHDPAGSSRFQRVNDQVDSHVRSQGPADDHTCG